MRRSTVVFLTLLLVAALVSPAFASEYLSPLDKLWSGIKDLASAPFQLIYQPAKQVNENDEKLFAFLGGLMEGGAQTAYRLTKGLFNIVTFPIY